MTIHCVIPDTQQRPGAPTKHLTWIGRYLVDQLAGKDDVKLIHLGDHWDFPSLSSYDRGKKAMEGRRVREDIEAGNEAFRILNQPLIDYNKKRAKFKEKQWWPERYLLRGNHEDRLTRYVNDHAELDSFLSLDALESPGWQVIPYLQPLLLDGIRYSHFFVNNQNGKPISGMIETRIKSIGCSFVQGHQQGLRVGMLETVAGRRRGIVSGSCLTPEHKVLTADLRYVPLKDLQVGDKLVSFDETIEESVGRSRRYKTGTVEAVKFDEDKVFAVTLESGKVFEATADHLWLTRVWGQSAQRAATGSYRWRRTDGLRIGTVVPRLFDEWETEDSYAAGYLAGMYDGEGCYYKRTLKSDAVIGQLSLAQKPGLVLDKTRRLLSDLCGVDALGHQNQRGVESIRLAGGLRNIAKVLGQIRPVRLLEKFAPEDLGKVQSNINDKVVSIEPLGIKTIVRVAIDAKTMVVEGYPHHNCYLHSEEYRGPQGAGEWRGILILHDVRDGDYDLMEVSLDYLKRRYSKKTA